MAAGRREPPRRAFKYVALLRGINVGGRNLVRMADIRACLEHHGFKSVTTYIQSGNILFESGVSDVATLTATIEQAYSAAFGHEAPVFLRSQKQLKKVVSQAPPVWKNGAALRRNVAFLRQPLTAKRAVTEIVPKPGVDVVTAGDGVVYLSTLMTRVKQSALPKISSANRSTVT